MGQARYPSKGWCAGVPCRQEQLPPFMGWGEGVVTGDTMEKGLEGLTGA